MKKLIMTLGIILSLGTGIEARTLEEAIKVCEEGNVDMCIGLGDDFKEKNPSEADKYYKKGFVIVKNKCNTGDALCCFSQADLTKDGKGTKKDKQAARKLFGKTQKFFQKSCNKGDRESCDMAVQSGMKIEML